MTDHVDLGKDGRHYPLTQKQEALAQARLECDSQSDAYRAAYNVQNMTDKQIHEEACVLFANPKVAQRVKELQQAAMKRHETTVDSITVKLDKAYDVALDNEIPSAMTSAALGEAKLHGLLIERSEVKVATADMSDEQIEAELAQIEAELESIRQEHDELVTPVVTLGRKPKLTH